MKLPKYGVGYLMQGVSPRHTRAYPWQNRLHWPMFFVTTLTIPAFYLELAATTTELQTLGSALYFSVFIAFAAYQLFMMRLSGTPAIYLRQNSIDLMMTLGAAFSLTGTYGTWTTLEWLMRSGFVILVVARLFGSLHSWFTPKGVARLAIFGVFSLALAGAGFYWLEPNAKSYSDGLWLAFVSGATVGYGDIVPSTPASRFFAVFIILIGYGLLSLVTAGLAAAFVDQKEHPQTTALRREIKDLHQEVMLLRNELRQWQRGDSVQNAVSGEKPSI
ncbi:MAG: potassium channel family protein [Gammaproteobacteria bacterium]|nr:potassium channel family protein [Gammaproteobacteria bacterium]